MSAPPIHRRTLVKGTVWAAPTITFGLAAPAMAASATPTCPAISPVTATGSITVPPGVCAGDPFTGDFTYSITNPTGDVYTVQILDVQHRVFSFSTGWGPWATVSATWTPTSATTTATQLPSGGSTTGSGNIPSFNQMFTNGYQVRFTLVGDTLPPDGCTFGFGVGYSMHCE